MTGRPSLADPITGSGPFGRPSSEATASELENSSRERPETTRAVSGLAGFEFLPPIGKSNTHRKAKASAQEPTKHARDVANHTIFRRLCDDIFAELVRIDFFLVDEQVNETGAGVVAEIENLLEKLYFCPYGEGEALKRVVVAIQSQVNNSQWDKRHVDFLKDIIHYLRNRYLVDEASVDVCYNFMKARGLDPFRGTLSTPKTVKHYRLEEVKENGEPNPIVS